MKHFQSVNISIIPHNQQRYDTAGDYEEIDEDLTDITISELPDWRYEALIAFHELAEYILIIHRGIKVKDIDKFDIMFERKRKKGNIDEPGDDKKAPYYKEHQFSTKVEKMLAKELGVSWKKYEDACNKLGEKTSNKNSR